MLLLFEVIGRCCTNVLMRHLQLLLCEVVIVNYRAFTFGMNFFCLQRPILAERTTVDVHISAWLLRVVLHFLVLVRSSFSLVRIERLVWPTAQQARSDAVPRTIGAFPSSGSAMERLTAGMGWMNHQTVVSCFLQPTSNLSLENVL